MTLRKFLRQSAGPSGIAVNLLGIVLLAGSALAQQNLVYINSNITISGQNAVIALVNDGNGNLTPLPGSPFLTAGTGVGPNGTLDEQWDSDGEVTINPEGTLLFAVNGDTDTIASFSIQSNGSLVTNPGSPFPSGGQQPASIAFADNVFGPGDSRIVVVNKNSDILQSGGLPNYTTFSVSQHGTLRMGQSYNLPFGASPAQAVIRTGKPQFFGIEFMNETLSSYSFSSQGKIANISTVVPVGTVPWTVGAVKNPLLDGLYVGLPQDQAIGVFTFNAAGVLSVGNKVGTIGKLPCWLTINAAGTVVYDTEPPSGGLTVFDVANSHKPVQLQHLVVSGAGALPTHVRLDPTGKFLYVLDRLAVLHIMNVNSDGTVEENITPYNLNLPSGTIPLGIAVLMK